MARIRINECDEELLKEIPHIKEARARTIIEHRTAHGPFTSIEQVATLPGFNKGIADKIRPYISFSTHAFRDERPGARRWWSVGFGLSIALLVLAVVAFAYMFMSGWILSQTYLQWGAHEVGREPWWYVRVRQSNMAIYSICFCIVIAMTCRMALSRRLARTERFARIAQISFAIWCTGILVEAALLNVLEPILAHVLFDVPFDPVPPLIWYLPHYPAHAAGTVLECLLAAIGLVLACQPSLAFRKSVVQAAELIAIASAYLWSRNVYLNIAEAVPSIQLLLKHSLHGRAAEYSILPLLAFLTLCVPFTIYFVMALYRFANGRLTLGRFLMEVFGLMADLRKDRSPNTLEKLPNNLEVLNGHPIQVTSEQLRQILNQPHKPSAKWRTFTFVVVTGAMSLWIGENLPQCRSQTIVVPMPVSTEPNEPRPGTPIQSGDLPSEPEPGSPPE